MLSSKILLFTLIVWSCCVAGPVTMVYAQPSANSLLREYVQEAWRNHPDIQNMREMVIAESSRTVMSRTWMNPEFRVGLMNAPTDLNLTKDPMTMFQIGVMQEIPFPGKKGAASSASKARTEAAQANVRASEFDMADMVIMAYFDLAAAIAVREPLERGQDLAQQILQSAAAMGSSGLGSQSDVLRARLETEQWNQRLVSNQSDIDRKHATLAYAIGRSDASVLSDPVLSDSLPALPDLTEALNAEVLNGTPEVQSAMQQTRAANAEVHRAKLEYWPDFSLGLAYGIRQDLKTTGIDPHTGAPAEEVMNQDNMVTVEVSVPLPLFYRGNQRARVSETSAMQRGAEDLTERARLLKARELRDLHAIMQEKIENYTIVSSRVLPQAEETWNVTMLDYRAAKLPFMSLSEARINIVTAEIDAIMLRADAWAAYYRWQAALGQLIFE